MSIENNQENIINDDKGLTENIKTSLQLFDVEEEDDNKGGDDDKGGEGKDDNKGDNKGGDNKGVGDKGVDGKQSIPAVLKDLNKSTDDADDRGDDKGQNLSPVAHLLNKYGYTEDEFKDVFKDIDLESDDIAEVEKFYEKRDEIVGAQLLNNFLESNPELKDLHNHIKQGLSIDTWKEKVTAIDWSKFDVPKDKPEIVENLVREGLKQKGLSDKMIERNINALKDDDDTDAMYNEAVDTVKEFDSLTKVGIQNKIRQEQEANKLAEIENQKVVKQITDVVTKGDLLGYSIPETERQDLIKYINSEERETKWEKLPLEAKIFIDNIVRKYDEKEGKFKIKGFDQPANNKKIVVKQENSGRKTFKSSESANDIPTISLEEVRKHLK